MIIGQLDWDIRVGTTVLRASAGNISIDDQNVPAITATVTVPYDADVFAELEPRTTTVPRVTITGRYKEWVSQPISAMSAYAVAEGGDISDLTAAWTGLQIREVSELFGSPLYPFAVDDPVQMDLDLHVREISHDDFEMAITLASDEALLTDWAPSSIWDVADLSEQSQSFNLDNASSWVNLMLGAVYGGRLDPSPYNTTTVSVGFAFDILDTISMSAYEVFRPALEDANLKLRVNPTGRGFSLQRPENVVKWVQGFDDLPGSHLFLPETVTSVRYVTSRSGDWYDAVMLTEDGVGGGFGYPRGQHTRTYLETVKEGFSASDSMAQNIYQRVINRGRFIDIVAPIRLNVFMTDEFAYIPEGEISGPEHQWQVKSVAYDFLAGTMNIRGQQRY